MFLLLVLLFVGGPLVVHEALRLAELHTQCTQHWVENALLLQNSVCADPRQRHVHGAKMEHTCRTAQEENAVSPHACAWRELWRQGGAYRLWDSIVGSPWMLFGLLSVCGLFLFQAWQHRAQRHLQERMYRETLELVKPLPQQPQPMPQLPPIQLLMPSPSIHYEQQQHYPQRSHTRQLVDL